MLDFFTYFEIYNSAKYYIILTMFQSLILNWISS